jgi:hypothetical protein
MLLKAPLNLPRQGRLKRPWWLFKRKGNFYSRNKCTAAI